MKIAPSSYLHYEEILLNCEKKLSVEEKFAKIVSSYLPTVEKYFPYFNLQLIGELKNLTQENQVILKVVTNLYFNIVQQFSEKKYKPLTPRDHLTPHVISFENVFNEQICVVASCKGRRLRMEDFNLMTTFKIETNEGIKYGEAYGVFDGHGGQNAAAFLKNHFVRRLVQEFHACKENRFSHQAVYHILLACCENLDRALLKEMRNKCLVDGSTASVAIILDGFLYCLNVGDSRIFYVNEIHTLLFTEEPKPTLKRHYQKVKKLNGKVFKKIQYDSLGNSSEGEPRIGKRLTMTRAYGNLDKGTNEKLAGLTAKPLITYYPLNKLDKGFLVVASDGLFEVETTNSLGKKVRKMGQENLEPEEIAAQLVRNAFAAGSTDNMTLLIKQL